MGQKLSTARADGEVETDKILVEPFKPEEQDVDAEGKTAGREPESPSPAKEDDITFEDFEEGDLGLDVHEGAGYSRSKDERKRRRGNDSDNEEGSAEESDIQVSDDGYFTAREKRLYERRLPAAEKESMNVLSSDWKKGELLGAVR